MTGLEWVLLTCLSLALVSIYLLWADQRTHHTHRDRARLRDAHRTANQLRRRRKDPRP